MSGRTCSLWYPGLPAKVCICSGGDYGDAGTDSGGRPILGNNVVGAGTVAKTLHPFKSSDTIFKPSGKKLEVLFSFG